MRFSKIVLTPHAPGSGTFCSLRRSLSTYTLRPAFASRCLVFSAASAAALTASLNPTEGNDSTKVARGSIRVREGGRARVYVYSWLSAWLRALDQASGVTCAACGNAETRPCAREEKKILYAYP